MSGSDVEFTLNTLAEAATTELSKEINPTTYRENVTVAKKGWRSGKGCS